MGYKIRFYRHSTLLLFMDGIRLLVDPMYVKKGRLPPIPSVFNLQSNPLLPFPSSFPKLMAGDIVLITHHHFDHFDKAASDMIDKRIPIVTPVNGVSRLTQLGFRNIYSLKDHEKFTLSRIEITSIPVKHTERFPKLLYKQGLGYLLRGDKKTVYISGDTILFNELLNILKGIELDLAVLYGGAAKIPFLGRHTLSHQEVLEFMKLIKPKLTLVVHLDCLNHCTHKSHQLLEILNRKSKELNIKIPEANSEYEF